MTRNFSESTVEDAALECFESLGYTVCHASELERQSYSDIILTETLQTALETINPQIPTENIQDAIKKLTRKDSPNLYENNYRFHKKLTDGVDVEYQQDGRTQNDKLWLIDFDHSEKNQYLAVNQFTVKEGKNTRRADVVIFINGLPIAVIELKNPANENATITDALHQLETYKRNIPSLFQTNELLIISDGTEARIGTLTADFERFAPWRTLDGETITSKGVAELQTLISGVFRPKTLVDILKFFIVFEIDGGNITKKLAGYHQYNAVNKAMNATLEATQLQGDKKVGVVWHTQGSGKSLTMAFYAGKVIQHLQNPTLVILTDRNDLDNQLFDTFSKCSDLLRQTPKQAENREKLQELLKVASGGIIFTTIQKFSPPEGNKYPLLSDRHNIILIADEAHRSQYGLNAKVVKKEQEAYLSYGFAKYLRDALPNASFIGFTGTPIETADINTPAVFGNYIDIYDIQRAVEDQATVKIYYEGRLAKIDLEPSERPNIDSKFEEITEDEETTTKERLKSKWARLEALVGAEKRINQIAKDIVTHFENRLASIDGKAMIVCMSRNICVDLYNTIITLKPDWHHDDDNQGIIKVVITGSGSDEQKRQPHIRSKKPLQDLAKRFKEPNDPLKLVIVRDMWLTGFDAPCLHTLYVDKPMKGHNLMQAIARVNRVYKDKPGGLVVDYLGIADQLKEALNNYSQSNRDNTGIPIDQALAILQEKYKIVKAMYFGFDYQLFFNGTPLERLSIIPAALDHILGLKEGKTRYQKAVKELSKAFALVSSTDEAIKIRDEVGFFQAIKAAMIKHTTTNNGKSPEEVDVALRKFVSKAVTSDEVIDIFAAAGLKSPNIGILSDEFLEEVRGLPYKTLALEALKKLINDEIKIRSRKNLIQARSFREMLENTIKRYQNLSIETAQVIDELIKLAKDIRTAHQRGENLGLSEDEIAFYDALEVNDSAVKVLGDDTLKAIARDLVTAIRKNLTIDWTVKKNVKAKLRVTVKRLLKKYGYPPDKCDQTSTTVVQQAELLCTDWVF
ncbi:MAG: type I restriction endonuclease subunit R [Trichodesmium sp. MAG_R01]|nr:type I restriction endonuclease subunit R [Trichodesmium sp. MAG_R01]